MKSITKIRKAVTILANQLNKHLNNLSASFKRAWQIIKGKQLISKVSGVTLGTRQRALRKLERYNIKEINVTLEREQNNKYDTNAIKVMVSVGTGDKYNLGYIPKDLSFIISPLLDKGLRIMTHFKDVTGGYISRETYGALIVIEV